VFLKRKYLFKRFKEKNWGEGIFHFFQGGGFPRHHHPPTTPKNAFLA
jgi:hypothetical protein